MDNHQKILSILQIAVPPDTPLTVAAEVQVLDLLGVVRNPQSISAMKIAAGLVPADTPATLKGLFQMINQLLHLSDKAKPEHHSTMADVLAQLSAVPDETLTFGTFLAICQKLLDSSGRHQLQA